METRLGVIDITNLDARDWYVQKLTDLLDLGVVRSRSFSSIIFIITRCR